MFGPAGGDRRPRNSLEFSVMDDRLKQVQTTDLTDSRLNHEFVAWLKTSGMNYLLMLLLIACAFLSWDWWNRSQCFLIKCI